MKRFMILAGTAWLLLGSPSCSSGPDYIEPGPSAQEILGRDAGGFSDSGQDDALPPLPGADGLNPGGQVLTFSLEESASETGRQTTRDAAGESVCPVIAMGRSVSAGGWTAPAENPWNATVPATKGEYVINGNSSALREQNIAVSAYRFGWDEVFSGIPLQYVSGVWRTYNAAGTSRKTYYWPEDDDYLAFVAWWPADFPGRSTLTFDDTGDDFTFRYSPPSTSGSAAQEQQDLMFSMNWYDQTTTKGKIGLQFRHLLSGIVFLTNIISQSGDYDGWYVDAISLYGLKTTGTCRYNGWDDEFEWSNLSGQSEYIQQYEYECTWPDDPDKTFFVIPQTVTSDVEIEISFAKGEDYRYYEYLEIPFSEFEAGIIHYFDIAISVP